MGMFDEVNVAIDCPTCGAKVDAFQSKDDYCELRRISAASVYGFYDKCRACGSWIEFERDHPPVPESLGPPMTLEEVEALGFRMTVTTTEEKLK